MENLNTTNEQPNTTEWDDLAEKSTDTPGVVKTNETTEIETPAEPTEPIDEEMAALDAMEEMEALESAEARQAAEIAEAESTESTETPEPVVEESVEVDDLSPVFEDDSAEVDSSDSKAENGPSLEEKSAQRFEREATGQDYGNFAKEEFTHFLNKLDYTAENPELNDKQKEENLNDTHAALAVVVSIMSTAADLAPTKPDELFNNIRQAYSEAATEARNKGKIEQADAYERQANVSDLIEQRCHLYLTETYAAYANQANAEPAAAATEENPLTGDAIS